MGGYDTCPLRGQKKLLTDSLMDVKRQDDPYVSRISTALACGFSVLDLVCGFMSGMVEEFKNGL